MLALVLALALSVSSAFAASEAPSFLWWNIAWGTIAEKQTLQQLARINSLQKPDVLVLGEYHRKKDTHPRIRRTLNNYKYFYFVPYSRRSNVGIAYFTRKSADGLLRHSLPVYDTNWRKQDQQKYLKKWSTKIKSWRLKNRSVGELAITLNGQRYQVFSTHLMNPWPSLLAQLRDDPSVTIPEYTLSNWMAFRKDLPIVYQAENFIRVVNQRILAKEKQKNPPHVVILGDFNAPDRVIPDDIFGSVFSSPSYVYKRLLENFSVLVQQRKPTIPTRLSLLREKKPAFMVDHAFTASSSALKSPSQASLRARVLDWEGSDHYPILVEARTLD